jgi:hypothetical protein
MEIPAFDPTSEHSRSVGPKMSMEAVERTVEAGILVPAMESDFGHTAVIRTVTGSYAKEYFGSFLRATTALSAATFAEHAFLTFVLLISTF